VKRNKEKGERKQKKTKEKEVSRLSCKDQEFK
jgi:hypothetical protein